MPSRRRSTRTSLTSAFNDVQRRLKYVESRPSPSSLANQVVTRTSIQPRAVSSDQIALRSVTNTLIEQETITENELGADSVGSAELQPGAVTTESFAPGSVDQTAIADDSIGADQLQFNSVGSSQLQDNSVGADKISDGSVTESKLAGGAVTESKIGSGAVTESKIANDAITSSKIATNAVGSSEIASGAVGSSEIANYSITQSKIDQGTSIITALLNTKALTISDPIENSLGGSYLNIGVRLGTGENDAAAGNHTHSLAGYVAPQKITGYEQTNALGHRHYFNDSYPTTAAASSVRYKKNITDYDIQNPEKLLEMSPKRFQYKDSMRNIQTSLGKDWVYGYLAEDLISIGLEEAVGYDKDGNPSLIDYSVISVLIVELVKNQQKKIEELSLKISEMTEERDEFSV